MSNTEHLTNITSIITDTLSSGLADVREYIYITAVTGVISVISFCALLTLYMFPTLAEYRIIGLSLRLTVLLGALNSFLAFMLMPPLTYALTIFVILVYTAFFLTALLSVLSKSWRIGYTWLRLGFQAAMLTKYLVRPFGTDTWFAYHNTYDGMLTLTIRSGKYYLAGSKVNLQGKFDGIAGILQVTPSSAATKQLCFDLWDGSSISKLCYRGAGTSDKATFILFGSNNTTV